MKLKLDKATFKDLEYQARDLGLGWMSDRDENYIYFTKWVWSESEDRGYDSTTRYVYSWDNGKLTVDRETSTSVLRNTDYVEDKTQVEKELGVLKSMITKLLNRQEVLKQFNDKTNEVIEPLYTPFGKVDGHGDGYKDENGPYELVKSFNEYKDTLQKAINHEHRTNCFDIVDAWVNEKECVLGGITVLKSQPLVKLRLSDKAYELRKAGKLLGPSIGCSAWTQEVIKSLKDEMMVNPKRLVSEFDFSQKRHHLSLTTKSVGGPASGEDWFIDLSKSMLAKEDLTLITEELGEEFTELEKKLQSVDTQEKAPSTSDTLEAQDAGVDKETLNKGKDNTMSEIEKAEFEALKAELAKMKAEKETAEVEKALASYQLSEEIQKGLAGVLVALEDKTLVTKALDAMVARVEAAEASKNDLAKSMEGKEHKPTTELEKQFNEEVGEAAQDNLSSAEKTTESILKQYRELDRKNK